MFTHGEPWLKMPRNGSKWLELPRDAGDGQGLERTQDAGVPVVEMITIVSCPTISVQPNSTSENT